MKREKSQPARADPATIHAALMRQRIMAIAEHARITHDPAPKRAPGASLTVTASIKPMDAAFTPSRNPLPRTDARSFAM